MDTEWKKRRRRLPKNRMKEIPNFEMGDIVGEFELDDAGAKIMVRDKEGRLVDKYRRRVNERGYLLDLAGNVVTKKGVIVFRKDEIDRDGEIPAPFCFEKKKEELFNI